MNRFIKRKILALWIALIIAGVAAAEACSRIGVGR